MNPDFPPKPPDGGSFSPIDFDQLPEAPKRGSRHRRAHSDTFFEFPDDFLFDVYDLDLSSLEFPAVNNNTSSTAVATSSNSPLDAPMAVDGATSRPLPPIGHLRSLSVDADFFDDMSFGVAVYDGGDTGGKSAPQPPLSVPSPSPPGKKKAGFHRRIKSMDGSSSSLDADSLMDGLKKAMTREKLAELTLIDPKKANRILSNRQSAARSKERRIRYTGELERKVQTLQTEATTLSAQVTMLQRDTTVLTTENRELKIRLQALEQQAQLKDALNETLKQEVHRLWRSADQIPSTNFSFPNRSSNPFGCQQTQHPKPY